MQFKIETHPAICVPAQRVTLWFFDREMNRWYPAFDAVLHTDTGVWVTESPFAPAHGVDVPDHVHSVYKEIAIEADKKVKQCRTVADAKEVLKEMSVAWVATLRLLGGDVRD